MKMKNCLNNVWYLAGFHSGNCSPLGFYNYFPKYFSNKNNNNFINESWINLPKLRFSSDGYTSLILDFIVFKCIYTVWCYNSSKVEKINLKKNQTLRIFRASSKWQNKEIHLDFSEEDTTLKCLWSWRYKDNLNTIKIQKWFYFILFCLPLP